MTWQYFFPFSQGLPSQLPVSLNLVQAGLPFHRGFQSLLSTYSVLTASAGAAIGFQLPPGEREPDLPRLLEVFDLLLLRELFLEFLELCLEPLLPFEPFEPEEWLLDFDFDFDFSLSLPRPLRLPLGVIEPAGASAGAAFPLPDVSFFTGFMFSWIQCFSS